MSRTLPYGRHFIDDDDLAAVTAVLRSDFLTTGPAVEAFETSLKAVTGAAHAIVCANGTAALHLAMLALGVGPGDLVIVPSITFLASANAARYVGADVFFADVDPETGLITPETLRSAIANAPRKPRAAVIVHLNGQTADLDGLAAVADEHYLELVEDACHAFGTRHRYQDGETPVGKARKSRLSCFSFHPVKTIAVGEGGAITTEDPNLAERLRRFRSHGMVRNPADFVVAELAYDQEQNLNPWHYEMPEIGFNYRLSDINCALGTSQLRKLERFANQRRSLTRLYDELLQPLAQVLKPIPKVSWSDPVLHLYSVLIDFTAIEKTRAEVMTELRRKGVLTQVHYIPVHRQPYYTRLYGTANLPGADAYFSRQLSLPLFFAMTDDDARDVVSALKDVLSL